MEFAVGLVTCVYIDNLDVLSLCIVTLCKLNGIMNNLFTFKRLVFGEYVQWNLHNPNPLGYI